MRYETQLPHHDENAEDMLYCTTCDQHVWTRGLPFCVFKPCPHILLFTDCEAEREPWCERSLRTFARGVFPEELVDVPVNDAISGSLYFEPFELLERLPRPDDRMLFAVRIEGEADDGLLLSTAPIEWVAVG